MLKPGAQLPDCPGGGVGEGAQHPSNIAHWRELRPALVERAQRFAFEIDDHDIIVCDENLPQMKISVDTGLYKVALGTGTKCVDRCVDLVAAREEFYGEFTRFFREGTREFLTS